MQASDSPVKISLPFADAGSRREIPVDSQVGTAEPGRASYETGFPPITFTPIAAGGIPPRGIDFNGVFYYITNLLRWQNSGGTFTFDAALAADIGGYPKGALLLKANGSGFWRSTIDDNSNDPDTDGTGWEDIVPLSTTEIPGIVEKATLAEAKGGATNKFPDAADAKAALDERVSIAGQTLITVSGVAALKEI